MTEAPTMTGPASGDFQFRVEVPFGPRWQQVELLRTAILHCLAALFQNQDFCEQLSMVAAELVENAIHYGGWDESEARPFRLAVRGVDDSITIEVANPIAAGSPDPDRLRNTVERLSSASARDAYLQRMRELNEQPDASGSGLGLMRIVYETGCRLHADVADGTALVSAVIPRAGLA